MVIRHPTCPKLVVFTVNKQVNGDDKILREFINAHINYSSKAMVTLLLLFFSR